MKRGAPNHPKMHDLADRVAASTGLSQGMARTLAVGLLKRLWYWTAAYAPAGDIGRHDDAAIAHAAGWDGDPAWFVQALVACRLLDEHDQHRLIVHDWNTHCETAVHTTLARCVERFADGTVPRLRWVPPRDRQRIAAQYEGQADADA